MRDGFEFELGENGPAERQSHLVVKMESSFNASTVASYDLDYGFTSQIYTKIGLR